MPTDWDLVIIGAGCSGLSLAVQLTKTQGATPKTLLIEQRKTFENDRTWCFWGTDDAPYADLIHKEWDRVRLCSQGFSVNLDCQKTPYKCLASAIFYDHALASIKEQKSIEIRMDSALLEEPVFKEDFWYLKTSLGELRCKSIVDTRPLLSAVLSQTQLWQCFLGFEVECEESIFDPKCALVMDFLDPNTELIGFNYVLPMSEKRALIEYTVFSVKPINRLELTHSANNAALKYTKGAVFEILRTEYGLIPMGIGNSSKANKLDTHHMSYVHVGLTGGAARSSTGYTFQRIQTWAARCAHSIKLKGIPTSNPKDNFVLRIMDQIFLSALSTYPLMGPTLFMKLFSKVPTQKLIRFLTEKGTLMDYLSVVRALPALLFLKVSFKLIFR